MKARQLCNEYGLLEYLFIRLGITEDIEQLTGANVQLTTRRVASAVMIGFVKPTIWACEQYCRHHGSCFHACRASLAFFQPSRYNENFRDLLGHHE
jgi:hypothetical protein